VEVFNELETRQITNVFGIIHGRVEPGNCYRSVSFFDSSTMSWFESSFGLFIVIQGCMLLYVAS